ncbi:hypothetical protein [Azonexus sp.]|uniref:hypothetical protein n=1 Tax=Azonexus sp. TaxID=1872668 RepID=UPI00283A97AF|nr:hypothetical protein [Azonexus sp.]
MFGIKKFLFRDAMPEHLPDDVQAGLAAWRASPAPALDEAHFHTRYLVVDIATSGPDPETDRLFSIAASAVHHSAIAPDDALYVDFSDLAAEEGGVVERRLLAFLRYAAKAPLVAYHVPYVSGFLMRACKERLGVDFRPQWIDLAWLLPAMFGDKGSTVQPLDHWLEAFGLDAGSGRRNAMENALLLARLLQMLLARANNKEIDSAARLIAESRASSFLRRVS